MEAAKIDGASDARVFFSIALPLAKVGLVSVILFMALQFWNDFYLSLYLITKTDLYTLQKLLYNMMSNISALMTIPIWLPPKSISYFPPTRRGWR